MRKRAPMHGAGRDVARAQAITATGRPFPASGCGEYSTTTTTARAVRDASSTVGVAPLSEEKLKRIEMAIERLAARQSAIVDRLEHLEQQEVTRAAASLLDDTARDRVVAFLDEFRAGEALGETSLGAWIEVCRDARLRGGLRVVQRREASHARLLGERIKELGGAARAEIPEATYEQVMAGSASNETSDADKVCAFTDRYPDPERALAPIHAIADTLDDDPETQSLLRTIAEDERATLAFFYAERDRIRDGDDALPPRNGD